MVAVNVMTHCVNQQWAIHTIFRINPAVKDSKELIHNGMREEYTKKSCMIGVSSSHMPFYCNLRVIPYPLGLHKDIYTRHLGKLLH